MYALHLPWAAPILSASGSLKIVQILSLGLSIASLIVIYQIVFETPLIQAKTARLYSFALICFLPQFIMFTLYVSNDTLAIFMGCLTVLQTYRFIQLHDWKQTLLLAVVLGLGLLTKATFLASTASKADSCTAANSTSDRIDNATCPRRRHIVPSCRRVLVLQDERFHKTVLNEFYHVAFRKKVYRSIDELQAHLDLWIREYKKTHRGTCPTDVFSDSPVGYAMSYLDPMI